MRRNAEQRGAARPTLALACNNDRLGALPIVGDAREGLCSLRRAAQARQSAARRAGYANLRSVAHSPRSGSKERAARGSATSGQHCGLCAKGATGQGLEILRRGRTEGR